MNRHIDEMGRWKSAMHAIAPLNRTIVSAGIDRAAEILESAMGEPAVRFSYPSGEAFGSWIIPPAWNLIRAELSDAKGVLMNHEGHPLFVAPYSIPFRGWVSREELWEHLVPCRAFDDAFSYEHRLAYDFRKRLKSWALSLPQQMLSRLDQSHYHVLIEAEVENRAMNVLEWTSPGSEETTVAILAHLCHPGQANDGLSGVISGCALLQRLRNWKHRLTYKLIVFPETIGSVAHIISQNLTKEKIAYSIFLETMGAGERLYLKRSRTGQRPIDAVLESCAQDTPDVGLLNFDEGYGNDERVFDFANVGIPSVGIQYFPYPEYHTSRDNADLIDWSKMTTALDLVERIFRRYEANRVIRLRYPGPPYLTRYQLYADCENEAERFQQIAQMLDLCDGRHDLIEMWRASKLPFEEVCHFFSTLDSAGLLKEEA
jgi:aminopeptidase-like protein